MIILSSLPFYLDINCENYIDAIFEATSGLTTTGATVYKEVESLSSGILIWRALLQWLGGLGIIIFGPRTFDSMTANYASFASTLALLRFNSLAESLISGLLTSLL